LTLFSLPFFFSYTTWVCQSALTRSMGITFSFFLIFLGCVYIPIFILLFLRPHRVLDVHSTTLSTLFLICIALSIQIPCKYLIYFLKKKNNGVLFHLYGILSKKELLVYYSSKYFKIFRIEFQRNNNNNRILLLKSIKQNINLKILF